MRKVIISTMVTLDGVMESPEKWSFNYWNEEVGKYALEQVFASDALLMGKATYEGFAEAWPGRTDEAGFADKINTMPKYVASTTLKEAPWTNSTIIQGSAAEAVARLKQQPGQNILKYGGGELMYTLIEHGLVDEVRLMVYPVTVGSGERIFQEGKNVTFKLLESRAFSSGVVALHYAPEKKA